MVAALVTVNFQGKSIKGMNSYCSQGRVGRRVVQRGSALRHPVEIDLDQEVGVTAHVDAVPQRGVVPRGAALGSARLAGAHQYLDVVELVEIRGTAEIASSGRSSLFLLLRSLPWP